MPEVANKKKTKSVPIVELKNISKSYGKNRILEDISVKIYHGDRIGIMGPNGGGKSTISEIITRVKLPTKGKVTYENPKMLVGVQFQDSHYPQTVTVNSMIQYYIDAYHLDRKSKEMQDLLSFFELKEFLKRKINSLSGGQKQRLNIFLSIMNNPELILLDELTTGLDIEAQERMRGIIHDKILLDKTKTLLLVSHTLGELNYICNRIWFIHNKKIYYDISLKDINKKYGSLEDFAKLIFDDLRIEKRLIKTQMTQTPETERTS